MISRVTLISVDRLAIDPHAPEPSYKQLADLLRARITSGEIGPRELLPSITYLTGETGLAVGTVRRAIAVLVEEGLAYTVPGRGTFASPQTS
jgi:DNA-binding GntR family transcriptional regulator